MEARTKREILKLVDEFPLTLVDITDSKKGHIKVRVKNPHGVVRLAVFSSSPSDHRVAEERRKVLRSIVRDLGSTNSV